MTVGDTFEYCGRKWEIVGIDQWGLKVKLDGGGSGYVSFAAIKTEQDAKAKSTGTTRGTTR